MANPDQARDKIGRWTKAYAAAREGAGLKSITQRELENIADFRLPPDDGKYEYFYHSFRHASELDQALEKGLIAGQSKRVYLSKDEIRDRDAGVVIVRVPKGIAKEGRDVVEAGLVYREWTVPNVPASDIVKASKFIPYIGGGGHGIREDLLAAWALKNPYEKDLADLPDKYKKWFK